MSITLLNMLAEKEWQAFIHDHPQGNIFHSPEMFRVMQAVQNHTPSLWVAVDDNEGIQSLLQPVDLVVRGGVWKRITMRAVAYGSLLVQPTELGARTLDALLENYRQRRNPNVIFTELRHLSDHGSRNAQLERNGFSYEPHLNYLIDLTGGSEAVLQRIGKRTRKQIRGGLRKGQVEVRQAENFAELHECYTLIKQTYANAHIPLADFSLFEAAFEQLRPKGMAQFWLAYIDGRCVASSVELPYKDSIYGWYSGLDRNYSRYYPGELLIWHVLAWGAENGYRVYDFGGAGHPEQPYGPRDFKAKFGGQLVNFGRSQFVHRPVTLTVSQQGYQLYRRLVL